MIPCPTTADLDAVRDWGAVTVVTLIEGAERGRLDAQHIGREVQARGMEWRHLPIRDMGVPGTGFEESWAEDGAALRAHLRAGRRIVLHCMGGLGRTGTITARLLIELGAAPDHAIQAVRTARPGAIETPEQEAHVRACRALTTRS